MTNPATEVTLTRAQKAAATRAATQRQREEEAAREQAELAARVETSLNSTAGKMLALMLGFQEFENKVSVSLMGGSQGPELALTYQSSRGYEADLMWFGNLTVASPDYQFQEAQAKLDELRAERAEQARLRQLARTTYDSLSEDQRTALGLTHRP